MAAISGRNFFDEHNMEYLTTKKAADMVNNTYVEDAILYNAFPIFVDTN
ncbi:MAG: hypothetical protein QNJ54_33995 [Prochloraceae cyanobacterium]|nr:hypothetical protein [Prochloraceae cyanobacterium]